MKINKETVKAGLKNQLFSILHMVIFNGISYLIFSLGMIGLQRDESVRTITTSVFPAYGYKCNIFLIIFSWIIFLIAFSIFYSKSFKRRFKKALELHWSLCLLFGIIGVIFCLVEVVIYYFVLLISLGLSGFITNYPDFMYIVVAIYILGYVILDFILAKRKKVNL